MQEPNLTNNEIILNSLLYIASKTAIKDYYNVLKVLYFADLHHLENYGSLIAQEAYVAMKSGPVPSLAYDMVKTVQNGGSCNFDSDYAEKLKSSFTLDGYKIVPRKEPNSDYFSRASLNSINYAIENYGNMSGDSLKQKSHDSAYNSAGLNDIISLEAMAQQLNNADVLIDYINNPAP